MDTNERASYPPGEQDKSFCGVCNEEMVVIRNVNGPTGMAEAMAKRKHLHDWFSCPHMEEEWHKQVKALIEDATKSSSKRIEDIMLAEAKEVIAARKETKRVRTFR